MSENCKQKDMSLKPSGNRLLKYDVLRAIAITFVIIAHVSAYIVIYNSDPSSAEFIVGNIFNGFPRLSLPLFVMLSGALLLNEDKKFNTAYFYKHSLLPMVCLLVFWLCLYGFWYAVVFPLLQGQPVSGSTFWDYLFTYSVGDYNHLWYMFLVVGIYVMIPVLRLFVKRENRKYILGIIVVCFIIEFLPTTLDILTENCRASIGGYLRRLYIRPANGFLGILLIGWYLNQFALKKSYRYILTIGGILCTIGSILAVQLLISGYDARGYFYDAMAFPVVIAAAAAFVWAENTFKNRTTVHPLLISYSKLSFGIYILHIAILELITRILCPYKGTGALDTALYILAVGAVTIVITYGICLVLSKIKGVKKILYLKH